MFQETGLGPGAPSGCSYGGSGNDVNRGTLSRGNYYGRTFYYLLARFYDRHEFVVKANPRNATPCVNVFQSIRTADSLSKKKEREENSERRLALELDIFEEGKERDRSKAFERSYLAITRIAEAH